MKIFVKAVDQTGPAYRCLTGNSHESVMQKSNRVVFIGPQIHKLFRDKQLNQILRGNKKRTWNG
jgi:hypothetical protein